MLAKNWRLWRENGAEKHKKKSWMFCLSQFSFTFYANSWDFQKISLEGAQAESRVLCQLCTQCMTAPMTHSLKDALLTSETLLYLNYDPSKIMEDNNASLWEERHLKHTFWARPCNPICCSAWSHWNCKCNPGNLCGIRVQQHRIGHAAFTNKSSWIILAKGPTRCHPQRKNLHKHLQWQHSGLGNPACPFQYCSPKRAGCAPQPWVGSQEQSWQLARTDGGWRRQDRAAGGSAPLPRHPQALQHQPDCALGSTKFPGLKYKSSVRVTKEKPREGKAPTLLLTANSAATADPGVREQLCPRHKERTRGQRLQGSCIAGWNSGVRTLCRNCTLT